jgi:hypothetical protein
MIRCGHPARWIYEHDTTHPIWPSDEQASLAAVGDLAPGFLGDVLPARWRAFTADCAGTATTSILECALAGGVGFLLAMEVGEQQIAEHVMAVADIIAQLTPTLILFQHRDVAHSLRAVCEDRLVDDYEAALITHIGSTPYGRSHDLHDFAGLVRFFEHLCGLADALADQLPIRKLIIDAGRGDWPSRERQITDFLGLPAIPDDQVRIEGVGRFRGRYADQGTGDILVVNGNEDGLYLDGARRTPLIPICADRFHVAAMCAEAWFDNECGGRFQCLQLHGNLPGLNQDWHRLEGEP